MYGKEHHWLDGGAVRQPRGCLRIYGMSAAGVCETMRGTLSIDLHRSCAFEYLEVEQFTKRETLGRIDNSDDIDD
jgi:hypothetical protein